MTLPLSSPRTNQVSDTTCVVSDTPSLESKTPAQRKKRRLLASALVAGSLLFAVPATAQLGGLGSLGGLLGGGSGGSGGSGGLGGLLGGIPGLGGLTGGGSGGSGGSGGAGGLDDIGGALGGIGDFFGQFQKLIQDMTKQVLGSLTGQLSKVFQGALGALGLPDLNKLSKDILKSSGADGAAEESESDTGTESPKATIKSISGVNPVIYNENKVASLPARTYAAGIFSKENQKALSKEAELVKQKISVGATTVSAIGKLTQQSSALSQKSAQTAKQAQTRISTQDALKDLNTIQGNVSSQLEVAAGQFAGLSNIQSNALELSGISTARLSQINLSAAGSLQQLADVNDQLRGEQQARLSANSDLVNRLSSASGGSFILLR